MCAGLRNLCSNSNRDLEHGILGLTDTCKVWDLSRVRWILTCISYFLESIILSWFYIFMTYFS
jgi:hypothetical protein